MSSGKNFLESLATYDQDTHSWRTRQTLLFGGLEPFSQTWPRSGMTANGTAFRLPTLAQTTDGIGSGLWPTPNAWDGQRGPLSEKELNTGDHMVNLATAVKFAKDRPQTGPLNPQWVEWLMGLPKEWSDLNCLETAKSFKSLNGSEKE